MTNKIKEIDLKNILYYFFDEMINIKIFCSNKIKIDEKSYKIFLFTKLDMLWSKNLVLQKLVVQILFILLSIKEIGTLKKAIEINI